MTVECGHYIYIDAMLINKHGDINIVSKNGGNDSASNIQVKYALRQFVDNYFYVHGL